jgi:hypothetical protein
MPAEKIKMIDQIYTRRSFYEILKITAELRRQGEIINHNRDE